MTITNRQFKGGEKLTGTFKGKTYTATAKKTPDGIRFLVEGMKAEFTSLSGAGAAIFTKASPRHDGKGYGPGGTGRTCNGWAFWSRMDEVKEAPAPAKATKPAAKKTTSKKATAEVEAA